MTNDTQPHVIKAGVIAILDRGGEEPKFLVVQPHGNKMPQFGVPPLVLPRGTRRYVNDSGALVDVKDTKDATAHRDRLESLRDTAIWEAHGEAGIPPSFFADGTHWVAPLGLREYASPTSGKSYPIHWEVMVITPEDLPHLTRPDDSKHREFMTLAEYQRAVEENRARDGYVPVMEEALALARASGKLDGWVQAVGTTRSTREIE